MASQGPANDTRHNPHKASDEAERLILGACLRDPAAADEVAAAVVAGHFRDGLHADVFRAALAQAEAGRPADAAGVYQRLCAGGRGGVDVAAFLADLLDGSTTANLAYFCGVVRDGWKRRALGDLGRRVASGADAGEPAGELQQRAERELFALAEQGMPREPVSLAESVAEALAAVDRVLTHGQETGVLSGINQLDGLTAGFRAGELVLLAARPSVGKTSVATAIAAHVAAGGRPVLFASLEMSHVELSTRLLTAASGVPGEAVRRCEFDADMLAAFVDARRSLEGVRLWIDDAPGQSVQHIAAAARLARRRLGLELLVIDYLQIIASDNPTAKRHEQVGEISRRLKVLARELGVPVLALAQLNREVEGRQAPPRLSDLRESGSLEQDADTVILLHRPTAEGAEGLLKFIVAKQRNGPTGEADVRFDRSRMRFRDIDDVFDD